VTQTQDWDIAAMPKNSAWGVNTKSVEANERKAEKKRQDQETKQKTVEDAKWKDENKLDQKKKDRKDNLEQKKAGSVARKEEARRLLAEEEEATSSKPKAGGGKGGSSKVTLSEIDKIKEMERKKKEQRRLAKQKEKQNITETPELETENPNRAMAAMLEAEDGVEARCVDDALTVLSLHGGLPEDKHPEKRMKAAYKEYEQRELPILKAENPNLKLSQLKQMLFKQWQKHPDNPMNR